MKRFAIAVCVTFDEGVEPRTSKVFIAQEMDEGTKEANEGKVADMMLGVLNHLHSIGAISDPEEDIQHVSELMKRGMN